MPDIAKKLRVRKRTEIKACAKAVRVVTSLQWQDSQLARQQSYLCNHAAEIERHLFDGFDHTYAPGFREMIHLQLENIRSLLRTIETARTNLKQMMEKAQSGEF